MSSSEKPPIFIPNTTLPIEGTLITNLLPSGIAIDDLQAFLERLAVPSENAHQIFLDYAKQWHTEYEKTNETDALRKAVILMGVSAVLGNYYAMGKLPTYVEAYQKLAPNDSLSKEWLKIVEQGRYYLKNIETHLITAQQRLRRYPYLLLKNYYQRQIDACLSEKFSLILNLFQNQTYQHFNAEYKKHRSWKDFLYQIAERLHALVELRFLNAPAGWLKQRIGDLVLGTGKSRAMARKNLKQKYVPQVEEAMEKHGLLIQESHVLNNDFLPIETLEITHPNPDKKPMPTMLVYPGRSVNFASGIKYFTDLAVNARCNVVVINNRNISMRSTKAAKNYKDLIIDGRAVVKGLIDKGLTTYDQLTLYGHCNGGPAATALAYELQQENHLVKLISDRSFKSHAALMAAYLDSKYQTLVPKSRWLRLLAAPWLLLLKTYFWVWSKRIKWLLRFSNWNHNQYKQFKKLPPELALAFMVQLTEKERQQGLIADDNVHPGAGLYEADLSHNRVLIDQLLQLKCKLENLRFQRTQTVDRPNITDLDGAIQTIEAQINFLLSHRVVVSKETMDSLGDKMVNPHIIHVSHLSSPLLDGKTGKAMDQIRAFVHADVTAIQAIQPDALPTPSPEQAADKTSTAALDMIHALTLQLYALERQRVAMAAPNTPHLFDQLRPIFRPHVS